MLLLEVGEDSVVIFRVIKKLRLDLLKMPINLDILLPIVLIPNQIIGVLEQLRVHCVHFLTGGGQVLLDGF